MSRPLASSINALIFVPKCKTIIWEAGGDFKRVWGYNREEGYTLPGYLSSLKMVEFIKITPDGNLGPGYQACPPSVLSYGCLLNLGLISGESYER